jgi:hypothetical protein
VDLNNSREGRRGPAACWGGSLGRRGRTRNGIEILKSLILAQDERWRCA